MPVRRIREFLQLESTAGLFLIVATAIAILTVNTGLEDEYNTFLDTSLSISVGQHAISKPLLVWINDGLMVVFFFLVGLELKREFVEGQLRDRKQVVLPLSGAIGGILFPALIFYYFNADYPDFLSGWAIPAATDIAFALGILSLCSRNVPTSAKIFLLTIAIFDDLAAIMIIAMFYTVNLSLNALLFSLIAIVIFLVLNKIKVQTIMPYIMVGVYLWICVLKSGVHATLAGVITAMFIPVSPLSQKLERDLHPWVAFGILPLFAFANTGINIEKFFELGVNNPITMGVFLGLFFGKQLGIFSFSYATLRIFKVKLPPNFSYLSLYGVSVLCGIGFTMSLFITSLAYEEISSILEARSGVLLGTITSAIIGFGILRYSFKGLSEKPEKTTS